MLMNYKEGVVEMYEGKRRNPARRTLDREAPQIARDLLEKDGLEVPDGATGRDVLRVRLQAMADKVPEAGRLACLLDEGESP